MHLHEPGTTLDGGRYRILELVGKGGMGAVYKARDTRLSEKVVAVKQVLDEEDDVDPEFARKQLKTESDTLEKLHHPGIPQVLDAFRENNANHIVMEFVEGTSLEKLLDHFMGLGGPMPQEMVIDLALKICDVLVYLHEQDPPVMHRDIKPQNVLVRETNQEVVLVDFGLAKKTSGDVTRSLVGTLGYAPLEQFKGSPELRSDIYGLGATMFHLISGKAPVPFAIVPLQEAFPKAHPALAAVVDRCCQEKPERRFANVQTVKAALKKVLGEMTGVYEDIPMGPAGQDALIVPPNQPMPASLFALLAVCLLVGGAGLLFGLNAVRQQSVARPTPTPTQTQEWSPVGTTQDPVPTTLPTPQLPDFQPRHSDDTAIQLVQASPELQQAAGNWFGGASRGAWGLVASHQLSAQGGLLSEPGKAGGALFQRTAQTVPTHLSIHVRRQQPCDVQFQIGDVTILSQYDQAHQVYGTQILAPNGGQSDVLFQTDAQGLDSTYELQWTAEGMYQLSASNQQVRFGSTPMNPAKTMTILLAPPDNGMVTIDFGDIETD